MTDDPTEDRNLTFQEFAMGLLASGDWTIQVEGRPIGDDVFIVQRIEGTFDGDRVVILSMEGILGRAPVTLVPNAKADPDSSEAP